MIPGKLTILIFFGMALSQCKEEVNVQQTSRNELCYKGKCIQLRDGYLSSLGPSQNGQATNIKIDITNGGHGSYADMIRLVFNSTSSTDIIPGMYNWDGSSSSEPQTLSYGMIMIITVENVSLFTNTKTVTYDTHFASQGSVTITKSGTLTTFTISLIADNETMKGSFTGELQPG